MEYYSFSHPPTNFQIKASRFAAAGQAAEWHLLVIPTGQAGSHDRLPDLETAYRFALLELKLSPRTAVFRRFFLSDDAAQDKLLRESTLVEDPENPVAVSIIQESPLPEGRVALWAYHIQTEQQLAKTRQGNNLAVKRGSLTHLWTTGLVSPPPAGTSPDSFTQTEAIFQKYVDELESRKITLQEETIRTWVFVRDIDDNYQGMVKARRDFFTRHDLTAQTHYIASTGIDGAHADPRCLVLLDAYAIAGIDRRQIRHLTAPERLGPTSAYGVTFERGTQVAFGDRRHLWISGTASIDPAGRIVAPGDVTRQTNHACGNIAALLADGGATVTDIAQMIVYVREAGDHQAVRQYLDERFPDVPLVILHGPVCRPGWLVEIECLAVVENHDERWASF